jgi:hypothetical protein
MSFETMAQNVAQRIFCQNEYTTFNAEKSSPKLLSLFVISLKLPKVNSHPTGETSPNLVTLPEIKLFRNGKADVRPNASGETSAMDNM